MLGEIQAPEAVEPLLKVMLDPAKGDVQATAVLALVKIGKPAVERTVKILDGSDEKLVAFHLRRIKEVTKAKEAPKDNPEVATAALVLGTIGRPEALQPDARRHSRKPTRTPTRPSWLARSPSCRPRRSRSKRSRMPSRASPWTPSSLQAPPRCLPSQSSRGQFYDPTMVDWLLERAEKTKGGGEDLKALQTFITVTAIKLAKADQLAQVKAAVDKYGTKLEKDLYEQADKLVKACGDRIPCYLAEMEKSNNQDQKNQFIAIKAGYMVGILGNESTVGELVERMSSFENAAVRFVAAQTIDHLLPKGSKDVADKLKKIIDKNVESGDKDKIAGDAPLKQVMYRVETRAG